MNNLFLNWLEVELQTRTLQETLEEINKACGTKYKHNWPSVMKDRGYTLERLPTNVRQYMMEKVLPEVLSDNLTEELPKKDLKEVIKALT